MSEISRRTFLGGAGAAAVGAALPGIGASRGPKHGDLRDIRHVVVVMQENRSFDHYFGALKGVRGFGDRSTIVLPGGATVWQQPAAGAGTQYPWRLSGAETWDGATPPSAEIGAANYGGTSHGWADQHAAWNNGLMNGWYAAKGGPTTLGYLDRADLPYHYALADAYTVGDAYHCSVLSATGPNRTYLWSGTVNASQEHGGYVAYQGGDELGRFLPWESYAETLQAAGVTWRAYQCADDYGDNGLEYFATFAELDPAQGGTAAPGDVYYDNGVRNVPEPVTGLSGNADNLTAAIRADVLSGNLPRVSWVISNQFFSEHPVTAPSNGAYLLDGVLKALAADPDVFDSTLVIINYDENDGQFDHVPPPVPAAGEPDEFVSGAPVGLGFRVPLILVSPWTRGGWVTSQTADHTSVIQFLEKWTAALGTPAVSPNISAWRRQVCGDLTDAFDFRNPVYGLPHLPTLGELIPEVRYTPLPGDNTMPVQEPGSKRARPIPVQPAASLAGTTLNFGNAGSFVTKASHFAVYDNLSATPPSQHTVAAQGTASAALPTAGTAYDVTVTGPNRFLRRFAGDLRTALTVGASYTGSVFELSLHNGTSEPVVFTFSHHQYVHGRPQTVHVPAHGTRTWTTDPLRDSHGWYDLTVTAGCDRTWSQRYAGHIETGRPSITG